MSSTGYPAPSGAHDVEVPRRPYTEVKDGFKTSESYLMAVFVAAVLIATYLDWDSLARADGWRYAAVAVAAYLLSRGLAKLGVRQPAHTEG